jgi:hypothetical protein
MFNYSNSEKKVRDLTLSYLINPNLLINKTKTQTFFNAKISVNEMQIKSLVNKLFANDNINSSITCDVKDAFDLFIEKALFNLKLKEIFDKVLKDIESYDTNENENEDEDEDENEDEDDEYNRYRKYKTSKNKIIYHDYEDEEDW